MKALSARNCDIDRQAIRGAEALWQIFHEPVYRDPLLIEEKFCAITIRFAHRGMRWVGMAQEVGISLANRRYRSELRARQGYGMCRPTQTTHLFSHHDDFDRAKARYLETLTALIEEHQSGLACPSDVRPRHRSADANQSVRFYIFICRCIGSFYFTLPAAL